MPVGLSSPEPPQPGVSAWVDDFASGSGAAIAGGVTTIGNMTFPGDGQSLREVLDRDQADARDSAAAGYVLHPVVYSPSPQALAELPALVAAGYRHQVLHGLRRVRDQRVGDGRGDPDRRPPRDAPITA